MGRPRPYSLSAIALALVVGVAACSSAAGSSLRPSFRCLVGGVGRTERRARVAHAFAPDRPRLPTATASVQPSTSVPSPTATPGSWTLDLYDARAVRWQNPDVYACTAASALMMLNMAAYWQDYVPLGALAPVPSPPRGWKPDITLARQESILAYQRKTGTMSLSWHGADAHGWRNSLNYYGWGSINAGVYGDQSFTSFDAAARATVTALALYRKPVGILSMAGNHAQIVTGYQSHGWRSPDGHDQLHRRRRLPDRSPAIPRLPRLLRTLSRPGSRAARRSGSPPTR